LYRQTDRQARNGSITWRIFFKFWIPKATHRHTHTHTHTHTYSESLIRYIYAVNQQVRTNKPYCMCVHLFFLITQVHIFLNARIWNL